MTPYTLNLLDLTLTLYAISHGALELNPLMRCIPLQVVYKVIVVGALCFVLCRLRRYKAARYGLWAITAVYAGIIIWHLINIF